MGLMADSLFLPLSFHASFSDIRTKAIPASTELMLLVSSALIFVIRVLNSGFQAILPAMINNAPPLLIMLVSSISGKSGIGDLEYATSMALFYPDLIGARTFTALPSIFGDFRIIASVASTALANSIMIAWLIVFSRSMARWFVERKLPSASAYIIALAVLILVPRVMILAPLFMKSLIKRTQPIANLPFIPIMFAGFLAAHYANAILL